MNKITYDKTIFIAKYKTMRKCKECKQYITLEEEMDNIVYMSSAFCHVDCAEKKMKSKKIHKMTEEAIQNKIVELKSSSEEHIYRTIVKNHLYKYLMEHYSAIMIPTYIYQKMEGIFAGTWKDMSCSIPPEHLLDMFQRKQDYLDKIYHKGSIDGVGRINYDLAVLISKYQGYLDWLSKKEIENKQAEIKSNIVSPVLSIVKNEFINKTEIISEDIFSDIE